MGSEEVRYGPGKEEEGNVEGYIDMIAIPWMFDAYEIMGYEIYRKRDD